MKLRVLVAAVVVLAAAPARAIDFSFSGFGTIGYAISNQPYAYQRFIDDRGTLKRDSVAGAQVDVRVDSDFSATLQIKAAPATRSDNGYKATVSWAFVSYRPTNDWLFRVGKQRIPFYLNSENYDVGVTYDTARLPTEMYSLAPSNDAIGVSLSKTWKVGEGELALDAVWGKSSNDIRYFGRDDNAPIQPRGTYYLDLAVKGEGLVLTYKSGDQIVRIGTVRAVLTNGGGGMLIASYPFVPIGPGLGYYQTSPALPGPGIGMVGSISSTTVTAGVDLSLPARFRIVSEFARTLEPGAEVAPEGNRGYVSILRSLGPFTPYVTYSFLRSTSRSRQAYNALNNNALPNAVPGAAQINASQRAGADSVLAYDQHSWALGTSYSFSATSKLKAEVMSTRVGDVSALVDAPQGGNSRGQKINVFSLSYSVVF